MELNRTTPPASLLLIGFMGTGKSTVSLLLQQRLGWQAVDTDALVEQAAGRSIPELFATEGEEAFRRRESAVLAGLAGQRGLIVSCGGGAPTRPENLPLMRDIGATVLLRATPETVLARVRNSTARPILEGHKNTADIAALMERRRAAYQAAADLAVDTDGKIPAQVCAEIAAQLGL